ncbi:hypothetical protein DSM104635_00523 [Terricaulis silvestris]|uniref:Uncharacterized protein n=1 Tax=Terricaulis silvestris TaxID=2686094 RepID=A0A6I6MIU9_9CAUL|nr:hypothetical protein DSM104635_00523 [Terricaulis silvestris]
MGRCVPLSRTNPSARSGLILAGEPMVTIDNIQDSGA